MDVGARSGGGAGQMRLEELEEGGGYGKGWRSWGRVKKLEDGG